MKDLSHLSADEWDEVKNPRPDTSEFDQVVERALSRRGFLSGVIAFGSGAAVMGTGLLTSTSARAQDAASGQFAFEAIPIHTDHTVHVPDGYEWDILARWGDPLFSDAEPFDPSSGVTVASSDKVFGENTDGMERFTVDGRQLIAVNHEYANVDTNLPHKGENAFTADDVRILQNIQGVTVMEIEEGEDGWQIVVDSPYNRRIHHRTPMTIAGPAAGHDLMKTNDDPTGTTALGTLNNCGAGKTPWGTYLTCEENFNGYFGVADPEVEFSLSEGFARYGIGREGRYGYELHDARFDVSKEPNEPNRHGWIVEIDPADPDSTPVKRTALGRFKHENAAAVVAPSGQVVVYLGDDERGEYLYRYVSNGTYTEGGPTDGLLDDGKLYVARFDDDLTGEWVELTPEATGMDPAEILIHTRMAASAAGGTTMDRPEWVAVNPVAAQGYVALTNNKNRGIGKANAGGDEMVINGPNPREANNYGQIARWVPEGDDHTANRFAWDLYVMAGNPIVGQGDYAGSENVTEGNLFNSPDGMQFDTTGTLWIQTDGDDSNEGPFTGMGNNQMLAGDPASGEIRRFLTGPNGSEVTGLTWSDDLRTMFVGIQHPDAPFPDGEGSLPRSAIVTVRRTDGEVVG
ncbi:PhoX family phosphatase [Jannaschia sp. S6380]|uniref:PhoX family protein n=1 Tax=Jannaschia sp. S6380 TaxID=2926408 RepID=UPI001FF61DA8|nr:PhoX family phosphatase [Jannaschia sp. S6380]MCK0167603.1 PhoX family phosphatase [Jannaschia sp. S6380]